MIVYVFKTAIEGKVERIVQTSSPPPPPMGTKLLTNNPSMTLHSLMNPSHL